MKPTVHKQELMAIQAQPEYVRATAIQLQKDFASFSVVLFEGDEIPVDWQSLFLQISPVVAELARNDRHKLVQLFYRVDLSERLLADSLSKKSLAEAVDEISVMLIFREWKKVKFRMEYNSGNNERLTKDVNDEDQA